MPFREFKAYLIPAAFFVGIATAEIFNSIIVMREITNKSTPIWRTCCACLVLLVLMITTDCVILDYINSPYPIAFDWSPQE